MGIAPHSNALLRIMSLQDYDTSDVSLAGKGSPPARKERSFSPGPYF